MGDQYGSGTVFGFAAGLELEFQLTKKMVLRGGGSYKRIAFDFDGVGDLSKNRNSDPDQDVFGALDQYFSFRGNLGYKF